MKCPKKSELLRLQSLYKTDARIADVLAVEEYLVAYWRRKKGLSRYSLPKFSREQIEELWSRYGDDFRCGRDLNISKAAFYSWRRKYEILERPAVLKLEQLELRLGGTPDATTTPTIIRPKTGSRKIVERCEAEWPNSQIAADWRLDEITDNSSPHTCLIPGPQVQRPRLGFIPETIPSEEITEPLWLSDEYGQIEWQMIEARAIPPGNLVIDSRRQATGLGGVGILNLSENSVSDHGMRVLKLEVTRKLSSRVEIEDMVLALLARNVHKDWSGAIVELVGGPVERLTVDRKAKLTSLIVHFGAAAALCPFDDVIRRHYGRQLRGRFPQSHPDRTATYDGEHFIEGGGVQSMVADIVNADSHSIAEPPSDYAGGIIVGPSALPFEIEQTAAAVRGRRIDSRQALLVCSATPSVARLAQRKGWLETISAAGGIIVDVALSRRIGTNGLIELAAGRSDAVICTRPLKIEGASCRIAVTSARTACELLRFV